VLGGAVAKALRQPLILGYLLGGVLIGPFTPGPTVSQIHQFEVLAEIGIILLMYFLAGLVVSEAATTRKMLDKLLPLRDAFVALFFVTVGALVDPRFLFSRPSLLVVIVILILAGKFVIWSAVVWLFRYPTKMAILVGLGLTQIGEFSYVLVRVARDSRLVGDDVYNATLAASVITIVVNGLLTKAAPRPAAQTRPA
jgi:K+:H+ antiporter